MAARGTSSNGSTAVEISQPAYTPQIGRPPRKEREPVRTGLLQSFRSLKEIMSNWNMAVMADKDGRYHLTNPMAAKLCGDQIRFLASKLTTLTAEVDKRTNAS